MFMLMKIGIIDLENILQLSCNGYPVITILGVHSTKLFNMCARRHIQK